MRDNELLDYYDANLNHLGVKTRREVHQQGLWHRTFHCHVIYRDKNGDDFILLQMRGANAETYPNMLDVSAAGHYAAGETEQEGVRELHEELGLVNASFEDLIPLGKRVSATQYDGGLDYQVADVFFYICDKPLREYNYQQDELTGLITLKIDDAMALLKGTVDSVTCEAVGFPTPTVAIRQEYCIPTLDNYFLKILVLAKRCLNGDRDLWV